jgi:hypothetical protein
VRLFYSALPFPLNKINMDEQINKKSIIFVFIMLILAFLFIYKGVILSGEEYYEEYINFRNQAEGQTVLGKLGKRNKADLGISEDNRELKLLGSVVSQLDNVKLELDALGHMIKNKKQSVKDKLDSLRLNNTAIVENIVEIVDNVNDQNSLENIMEMLNVNIKVLRSYINEN